MPNLKIPPTPLEQRGIEGFMTFMVYRLKTYNEKSVPILLFTFLPVRALANPVWDR